MDSLLCPENKGLFWFPVCLSRIILTYLNHTTSGISDSLYTQLSFEKKGLIWVHKILHKLDLSDNVIVIVPIEPTVLQ